MPSSSPTLRSVKSPQKHKPEYNRFQIVFRFIKEWGGVITLFIALLYTFPFDVFEKYTEYSSKYIDRSRDIFSEVSSLYAEKIKALNGINDNDKDAMFARNMITNMYDGRIYNKLHSNIETFQAASNKLTSSELYSLGSLLAMNGRVDLALQFYDKAISKQNDPNVRVTVLREKANALLYPGPNQNYSLALESYLSALDILSNDPNFHASAMYISILGEVVIFYYNTSNFACANFHRAYFEELVSWAQGNRMMSDMTHMAASVVTGSFGHIPIVRNDPACKRRPTQLRAATPVNYKFR